MGTNPSYEPLYPVGSAVVNVTEDFTYSGLGGRLSSQATSIGGGANGAATETWAYNNLGLILTHGHPRFPNGADSAALSETFTYSSGVPTQIALAGKKADNTAISAATVSATYTPAGTLATYTAVQTGGATQTTTVTQDANLLPRPAQIATSIGGFGTGTYAYDGAGNVLSMTKDVSNGDTFTYDNRSRLVTTSYKLSGSPTSQTASYDQWGNLLGITGTGGRSFCGASCANNRLPAPASYDGRGNLLTYGGETLTWDGLNRQRKDAIGTVIWQYAYQGDSERVLRVPWWATSGPAVTRRETARFLTQAANWTLSTGCAEGTRSFTDVHCADQDWQPIETFYDQGITAGCGGGAFCADSAITRGQMMVFLLKAEHGSSYIPPACTPPGVFADVACPSGQFVDWIERAYAETITGGCGGSNFCPTNNVTEWQMAVYVNKLYSAYRGIPGGSWYILRDGQNRVVTEFYESSPGRDNVYFGNLLAASYVSHANSGVPGWQFHSSDHLGTVRLTVNGATGATIESAKYWPYGDRYGSVTVPAQKVSFAGMERDGENNHFSDHARNHDFNLGRFVSPDNAGGDSKDPQTWNRYAYARNNPLRFVDQDGLVFRIATGDAGFDARIARTIDQIAGQDPRLSQMVEGLRASTNVHAFGSDIWGGGQTVANNDDDAENGRGTGSTIYVDSDLSGTKFENTLAHELSHSEDDDTGSRSLKAECAGCANATESKAVRTQNLLTSNRANPMTTYNPWFGAKAQRVKDPTAVPRNSRKASRPKRQKKPDEKGTD